MLPENLKLDFMKAWSDKTGVPEDELIKEFTDIFFQRQKLTPSEKPEAIANRAQIILSNKYRQRLAGGARGTPMEVLVVFAAPFWDNQKKTREELARQVKEYELRGDLKTAIENGLVRIDERGQKVLLYPKFKKDGGESGNAGKDMREDDTLVQYVFGLVNENGALIPAKMLRKRIDCRTSLPTLTFGKINVEKAKDSFHNTDYILHGKLTPIDDSKIAEKIKGKEKTDLIAENFKENVVLLPEVISWAASGVPEQYKSFVVIKDTVIADMNLVPNKKGNVSFIFGDASERMDPVASQFSYMKGEAAKDWNYGIGTKVMVIGRAFIGTPREGYDKSTTVEVFSMIPYKGFEVPMKDVAPLSAEDIIPTKSISVSGDEVF